MDEHNVLKLKENVGGVNIALRANVGLKISAKTTANTSNDDTIVKMRKSLSLRKDKLAEILNSKTFQPLFIDSNGSPLTIGTSSNICDERGDENMQPQSNNEGMTHRALNGMEQLTPPSIVSHICALNPKTPQHHMLARLQRDLDSPSAATRLRAMRALKSPANGPYNQFDVPHEEQDIITEEERQEYVPQTIQDVMKDVIVYVEARFGDDNRTASIKQAMAEIGATVNDNFNKNTTHVIFSNGTQSTYNKAKQLNIPIVSVLWIEACKKQLRLVDPSKFAIHNIEQYENPELYKKVKVKKFFQTDNELKIKRKKITPPPIKFKPIKVPKKAKDNLTGMMNEFQSRQIDNSNGINYFSKDFNVVDLFDDSEVITDGKSKRINSKRSLVFDDVATVSSPLHSDKQKNAADNTQSAESYVTEKNLRSPAVFKTPSNRKTIVPSAGVEHTSNSLVRVTRRSSMVVLSSQSMSVERNRNVQPEEITEITNSNDNQTDNNAVTMEITPNVASSTHIVSSRKTMFASSAMDLTDVQPTRKRNSITPARFKDFEVNTKKYLGKNSPDKSQSEKSNRRRTVFASDVTITSPTTVASSSGAKNATKTNRRRTVNTLKQTFDADTSQLNTIQQRKDLTVNQTVFAPNDASSPLVANKDEGRNLDYLRRTLFKENGAVPSPLAVTPPTTAALNEAKTTNSKRRRTLLPLSDTTSTPSSLAVAPSQGTTTVPNRRRTCVSTSQSASYQPSSVIKDKQINGLISALTPQTKTAEQDNNLSSNCLTPQRHTLFEEYSKRLSFSSTNKRHTDRDISLFIIEQRLKNLNEIARLNRSVSESEPNVDSVERRIADGIAKALPQLQATENANSDPDVPQPPPSKKRKLFNPTAYEEQVAMQSNDSCDNNNKATVNAGDKLPITQTTKIPSRAPRDKKTTKQRRSTMDFKVGPPKPVNIYASIVKSNAPLNYLAYSNMNPDQMNVINKAVSTLGKFKVESNVTKKTTHLVTFDSKRTQKFLRAIIRGLWIINYDWVTSSLEAGTWLYEEPFENRSVSTAVSMCRAEAQAFGSKYKIEIFGHIEPIYISSQCKCPALTELYTMCGGRVTNSRQAAKYIITDKYKDKVSQRCLHSDWILDSITAASCKSLSSYILKLVPQQGDQ